MRLSETEYVHHGICARPKAIAVKGIVTIQKGWTLTAINVYYWQSGKAKSLPVKLLFDGTTGKWAVDGLNNWTEQDIPTGGSNVTYNVIVEARMNSGTMTKELWTQPKPATSSK